MHHTLHITNGDSAANLMQKGGVQGKILPWRDILHEGPVPADLDLVQLSRVRSQFIVDQGWGDAKNVFAGFQQRDQALESFQQYAEVLLWFEHDLYDQLQILQLLHWFHSQDISNQNFGLICTEQYLGMMTAEEIVDHTKFRQQLEARHFSLGSMAWNSFRSTTPHPWHKLLGQDTSALPFLDDAVRRMLQEYPSIETGLGKTETRALTLTCEKPRIAAEMFGQNQLQEQRIYLGDLSYWNMLNQMLEGDQALLQLESGSKALDPSNKEDLISSTALGRKVIEGTIHRFSLGLKSFWIGGVEISQSNPWCWDERCQTIVKWTE